MHTLIETRPGPERVDRVDASQNRLTLAERIALHLGLALIIWGRRRFAPDRDESIRRFEADRARAARERANERLLLLTLSRR